MDIWLQLNGHDSFHMHGHRMQKVVSCLVNPSTKENATAGDCAIQARRVNGWTRQMVGFGRTYGVLMDDGGRLQALLDTSSPRLAGTSH